MLQFITHHNARYDYAEGARQALLGGCRWVQLRIKEASDDELCAVAERIAPLCREHGATFVIDDRVHLVAKVGADGVHLGKEDMPVDEARAILGPNAIIGATANKPADAAKAYHAGASYIGYGPYRFTTTKQRLAPTLGIAGYQALMGELAAQGISIPVVAIGGITLADVPAIMATGVQGIAISGAVLNADDPAATMARFVAEVSSCRQPQ